MASRGGGGGGVQGIPAASRKMVQSLKEIVNGVSDVEIYSALKDCNMDPNEAVNRLLSQDPFHEVKSKREKKKEFKDTTESRPRGGSTSSRGARSSTDRHAGRGGSSQFSSSDSGGLYGKSKRENGTSSYTSSYASSSAPAYGAAPTNTNRAPPSYSDSIGYENKASTYSVADSTPTISQQQPSSGYQSAWSGVPGQKSMADIVKMGLPQNKSYTIPISSHPPSTHYEVHQQHDVSPEDDWPVMEQPQIVNVQSISEPHVESENLGQSYERDNNLYTGSQLDEAKVEDENVYEDQTANYDNDSSRKMQEDTSASAPIYDGESYKGMHSFHPEENHAYEHNEAEEGDASASSISANLQQLNLQEERQLNEPEEEDVPSVVIPDHLQVHTADCSHLSFGSFGANTLNPAFSGSFASRQSRSKMEDVPAESDSSPVRPSDTRDSEYYGDESVITSESSQVHRTVQSSVNYDLPSVSQTDVLKQENADMNQYSYSSSTAGPGYTFDGNQLLNQSFPQSQTPAQMPNATPFSSVMQAAYTNSLPSSLLAANGHPVREFDLSYSPFPVSQSLTTKYGSSISGSTVSMSEALKTGVFSSSQPTQQTSPGNAIPSGPTVQQHLLHPYSQPTLPLGPYANMIGYPFLPQSYTYMPSGFQQAFAAGNSTYHQQLAAVLPQYKNSVSVSSLPQSASVPSGYGSFGNSTPIPGNYQANNQQPTGSTLSYDDALNAHYKETAQLLSLQQQQQNDNSAMWVHGAGSRTMPAVPASTYYSFQGQNQQQQPSGFRQGHQQQAQPPSQNYGGAALNYQNYYQSQTGISQEHQLHQNPRDGSLVGGSQSQPKPPQQQQSQQLWQNSY
ncbi:uncharacterized protein [Rutidosis leptorrhynchoides]|uniref:uncharacterized protein isoform X2 n=1 Tax=Rutidosis leptorrhynchoides TaxID=125765 RepID=UPI003A9A0C6D